MTTSTGSADTDVPLEFLVGHHSTGGWFVVEAHGLAGGLFRSECDAFKFLAEDFQTRAKRIEVVGGTLDPFAGTCVEIAQRCRAQSVSASNPIVPVHTIAS